MKQFVLSLFLILSITIFSNAQTELAPVKESETASVDTLEHSLLWEISGNGLKKSSYLYGTIHLISKEDFFLTENTEKAIDSAEQMTFEINMADMNNISAMMSMMMNAFMKDGGSLKKLLTEEEYKLVDAKFQEIGLPLAMFDKLKPMFTSMMTQMDMSGGNPMEGQEGMTGYEMEFMEMAKQREMEMNGLETIEYQMSMFDSIPYEAQARMLIDGIKAESAGTNPDDQMEMMMEQYKSQNLNALSALISSEEGGMGDYEDVLLVNRNRNWIPIMAEQMKDKSTFFAVGAGHLGGEEGVINLLRKEGYQVTAMY